MIALPSFHSGDSAIDQAFRIALGTLVANVSRRPPQGLLAAESPLLLAGLDYSDPWTRDASFNAWYAASQLMPQIAEDTLLSVVAKTAEGFAIQGDYWDAIIWVHAAWEHVLRTGNQEFLALAFQVAKDALVHYEQTEFDSNDGLFRGGACFMDGISAYPDSFVTSEENSGIMGYARTRKVICKSLSTNCLYYMAYQASAKMAVAIGKPAGEWNAKAERLAHAIDARFYDSRLQRYRYLLDAQDDECPHRQEGLGLAILMISGLADTSRARHISQYAHRTPQGLPSLWPTFKRYARLPEKYGRHSGTVWPQVNAAWCIGLAANDLQRDAWPEIRLQASRAVRDRQFRELYHPETGEPFPGLQEFPAQGICQHFISAHGQTWAATGFLAMVFSVLAGLRFQNDGLRVEPWLPPDLEGFTITGLPYRDAQINLMVCRDAAPGKPATAFVPADTKGQVTLELRGKMSQF